MSFTKTMLVSNAGESAAGLAFTLSDPLPQGAPAGMIAPQRFTDVIPNPTADDRATFKYLNMVTVTIAPAPTTPAAS